MRKLEIAGRAIVPLRAVTFVSAGEISPLTVAIAIADRSRYLDEREFASRLHASWLAEDGVPSELATAHFSGTLEAVGKLVQDSAPLMEQVKALPAGTFVYRQDLEVLVHELNERRRSLPPDGPGLPPIDLSGWPRLSAPEESVLLEGFEKLAGIETSDSLRQSTGNEQRYDTNLEKRAQEVAQEMHRTTGHWPFKNAVVKRLAKEVGRTEGNVARSLRKTWGRPRRKKAKGSLAK